MKTTQEKTSKCKTFLTNWVNSEKSSKFKEWITSWVNNAKEK